MCSEQGTKTSMSFGSNRDHAAQVGINYGNIYLPPDQHKTTLTTHPKPQPCSTVPFQKDAMFIGREDVIHAINKGQLTTGQRHVRMALWGLAGVGKTQTAIAYSYSVRESTPDTWVFWIHASNEARLEQSYQEIAAVAGISGRPGDDRDPKTNILQLVYQWLCDPQNGRWLIVLDNADDDSIFFSENKEPLVKFLPQAAHGSILITSRNALAARNLVGSNGHMIEVQPMNEEDSLALLRARTRIPAPQSGESEKDEKALVQALEYLPLAITQAGSYIANRPSRFTVSRYLELFRKNESNQTRLLQYDAKDPQRDATIRYAVVTTWQLSFEQIRLDRPAATDLLALMSMFDRQGIPEDLVCGDGDELYFEDTVAPLIDYSLVRSEPETASFNMHRLVQLSVRKWLQKHKKLAQWQEKSRAIMAKKLPDGKYKSWNECQRLLPHAKEVMKSTVSDENEKDQLHMALINFNCGHYLLRQGTYKDAEAMHRRALEARESVFGCEHPDTLASVCFLGLALDSQGKYEEAEEMFRRALAVQENILEREHPDTLVNVNNVGNVLLRQGKHKEAQIIYDQVLRARESILGYEHPDTLSTVNGLGNVLSRQGKDREAEAMHQRALEARKKVLGSEHPDTLVSFNDLGNVLSRQGKDQEAEAIYLQVLKAREQVLGCEHPDTLITVNGLGNVLSRLGKYQEAEEMHQRALETREKVLGRSHPDTLFSVNGLGKVLSRQGKYREAEAMYQRALEARENVLGLEHPDTLVSANSLGNIFSKQGRYQEAEMIYQRVLEIRKKILGHEHPDTLVSFNELGNLLSCQTIGKHQEAEAIHQQVLEIRERVLGYDHPDTLTTVNDLGLDLFRQGKYGEAEAMNRRVSQARERILGRKHPHTLISINDLANTLFSQGKKKEAEAMHRQVLELRKELREKLF